MATNQNRLSTEKSPYLLQHANNPVDWYPWGEEAFEKAKKEDKPIFLSIGYATCHWCHVMAHESFEDEDIAKKMNETFVNIKVDREERPDIDNTYMMVCQMLTGSGGWPLTIIMTPDKKPFYAATYLPKRGRGGRPGMHELIPWINELWNNEREKINNNTEKIVNAFQQSTQLEKGDRPGISVLDKAYKQFSDNFDEKYGGFGSAPKFPSPHNLMFLLRCWHRNEEKEALDMVQKTLIHMRRGGIFDQVGMGFHRYSTDRAWLVPHFEKMLYDQAMLSLAYTEAWQITGNALFEKTTNEILEYVLRDLLDEEGGFYSAEDADSEGEEGKFYVWSINEVRNILSPKEAELAIEIFNMSEAGNYNDEATGRKTGRNILHLKKSYSELAEEYGLSEPKLKSALEEIRDKLFSARKQRVRPLLDDKILTDWNGMMIAALAKAGNALDIKKYIRAAQEAAAFIFDSLTTENNNLLHRYRDGEAAIAAHADDYAFLTWGLIELYEATFENRYLSEAIKLKKIFIEDFWDPDEGGFYFTSNKSEKILGRKREGYDGALPSANSVAMLNLAKLGRITGNTEWEQKAEMISELFSKQIEKTPTGFSQMLQGVDFILDPSFEITISGKKENTETQNMLNTIRQSFIPNKILVLNQPGDTTINELAPYTKNQTMVNDKATAYVCQNYACKEPTNDPTEIFDMLQ